MTLFRQIILVFTLFFLVMLAVVLAINFSESRAYIEEKLYTNAQNTASTLAVTMSQSDGDVTKMSVIADAVFDTGYYRRIALEDMRGRLIFEKSRKSRPAVPAWFLSLVKLDIPRAYAQVSAGWRPLGMLEVVPDTTVSVEYLYTLFKKIVGVFAVSALVGVLIIALLLRMILRPLRTMESQAEGVLQNRFILNRQLPKTLELKRVTEAINALVERMEQMHEKLVEETRRVRELEYRDALTGLYNRRFFLVRYDEYLKAQDSRAAGVVVGLRLCNTAEANKRAGFDSVNRLIAAVAEAAKEKGATVEEAVAARISGVEMALLLPGLDIDRGEALAEEILHRCRKILDGNAEAGPVLYLALAVVPYDPVTPKEKFFSTLDVALNAAASQNRDAVRALRYEEGLPTRKSTWRQLISRAIEEKALVPKLTDIFTEKGGEVSATLRFDLPDGEGGLIPYRVYGPTMAELGLFADYARYLFDYLLGRDDLQCGRVFVEMPMAYLDTTHHFDELLGAARKLRRRGRSLVVALGQGDLLRKGGDAAEVVADELRKKGVGLAVVRFDADTEMLQLLHRVRPGYVKMDVAQFLDMGDGLRNSLLLLLKSVGATLLIGGVSSPEELERLEKCGEGFVVV
ncbi:bifunctional diguanylate cyclase/phosphodiesterase [Hydrogenimonas sp.]